MSEVPDPVLAGPFCMILLFIFLRNVYKHCIFFAIFHAIVAYIMTMVHIILDVHT